MMKWSILVLLFFVVMSTVSGFQLEVTFKFSRKTYLVDVTSETTVDELRDSTIEFMRKSEDEDLMKAAERADRWKLVSRCSEEEAEMESGSQIGNYGLVDQSCTRVLVDYKPKEGQKIGLMGGAWGGNKCASGWFEYMGSLQRGMIRSKKMSIDSHTCGVTIFPTRQGLKGTVKVHGHTVHALGLTAKHCVSDLGPGGRDRDILFSEDPHALWVSVGTHHVNTANMHLTVLGYISAIGSYDRGNDVSVLILGKLGPSATDKEYDLMIRNPAPSIGRPFAPPAVPHTTITDDQESPKTCPKVKKRQECEKVKGCRYVKKSGHLWWKKYECVVASSVVVDTPSSTPTAHLYQFPQGVRGSHASLTVRFLSPFLSTNKQTQTPPKNTGCRMGSCTLQEQTFST